PLTEQLVKGRTIRICEIIRLHCVWTDHAIFLKPIPAHLMSYAFWPYLQDSTSPLPGNGSTLISHVLGFLETYIHLIQHESDMYLAHEHHLIPFNISFLAFISFIEHFSGDALLPTTIHRRYPLGEFSLSPLNT
ncbi:hypothetical protein K432DRAFT_257360, partial [Lepidopterella palustris CBS 459.81]